MGDTSESRSLDTLLVRLLSLFRAQAAPLAKLPGAAIAPPPTLLTRNRAGGDNTPLPPPARPTFMPPPWPVPVYGLSAGSRAGAPAEATPPPSSSSGRALAVVPPPTPGPRPPSPPSPPIDIRAIPFPRLPDLSPPAMAIPVPRITSEMPTPKALPLLRLTNEMPTPKAIPLPRLQDLRAAGDMAPPGARTVLGGAKTTLAESHRPLSPPPASPVVGMKPPVSTTRGQESAQDGREMKRTLLELTREMRMLREQMQKSRGGVSGASRVTVREDKED